MGKDKVQKSLFEALNSYEKQEEVSKSHFFFRKWVRENIRAVSVGSWAGINQTWKMVLLCLEFNKNVKNSTSLSFKVIPDTDWCQERNVRCSLLATTHCTHIIGNKEKFRIHSSHVYNVNAKATILQKLQYHTGVLSSP